MVIKPSHGNVNTKCNKSNPTLCILYKLYIHILLYIPTVIFHDSKLLQKVLMSNLMSATEN